MNQPALVRIATRASRLALWQSEHVASALAARYPALAFELVPISTAGDRIIDQPLAKIGGKGLFIKELEVALSEGRADLAVHSMKDVPAELPEGFEIAAILKRADARDVLVSAHGSALSGLAAGSRIGTSSLRRRTQLLASRPDLEILDLRGNVPTRLARLERGDYDAIVLAAAGLERLELLDARCHLLAITAMLPAVGQGAIGIECRAGDERIRGLVAILNCARSAAQVAAERAMNATLGGSCEAPVAGHARLKHDEIELEGLIASVDGAEVLRQTASGPLTDAVHIGRRLGEALLASGADRILESFNVR